MESFNFKVKDAFSDRSKPGWIAFISSFENVRERQIMKFSKIFGKFSYDVQKMILTACASPYLRINFPWKFNCQTH